MVWLLSNLWVETHQSERVGSQYVSHEYFELDWHETLLSKLLQKQRFTNVFSWGLLSDHWSHKELGNFPFQWYPWNPCDCSYLNHNQCRIQKFLGWGGEEGAPTPKVGGTPIVLTSFPQRRHEHEKYWTMRGHTSLAFPLGSANDNVCTKKIHYYSQEPEILDQ